MLLNKINKERISSKPFKSVLLIMAKTIYQSGEGFKKVKNL